MRHVANRSKRRSVLGVLRRSSCSFGMTSEIVEYLTPENRERLGTRSAAAEATTPAHGHVGGCAPELLD
jgi:hypothetical protein